MKTKFSLLITIFFLTVNCVFSQIWSNLITGTDPALSANPYTTGQTVVSNLTVSGIGLSGVTANAGNNRYNAKNWYTSANPNSINANKYFYFTLTADPGYVLNLQNFIYSSQASGTGPTSFSLRSSVDNYATDIPTSALGTNVSIDLSGSAYQSLSTITFRLYGWGGTAGGGTFSVDDFSFWGSVTTIATTSLKTDYFQSTTNGTWNSASTWVSSHDNISFIAATIVPDSNAASITIKNGHTVSIDAYATAQLLTVDAGGTLTHTNGVSLKIYNGSTGYDFIVNGTYVINGTQPTISGTTTAQINGLVRADANTSGESDDFARNTRVVFTTGAVFQWNTTSFFETASGGPTLTYFPNSGSFIPIFRVTANVSGIGANNVTLFNSKFEVASGYTVKFQNAGTKAFRNGLGGDGTIYHWSLYGGASASCGTFLIGDGTAQTATIDGNLNIVVQSSVTSVAAAAASSDFVIASNATTTISGSPTITIGQQVTYIGLPVITGAIFEVDGTLINNSANPIDLTYGRLIAAGTLSSSSTGTFKCSSTFTRIISAGTSANTSVGVLKLTTGANTVYSFEMGINASTTVSTSHRIVLGTDVVVANNISLYQGILVTDYKILTLNYTGASSLVYPSTANYKNSFIATCDQNGNTLVSTGISPTTLIPYDGSVGFRINNVSGKPNYVMFPVGYNFKRPSKIAINPNTLTATNITVVVTSGDLLNTPMPRVNRIWFVHTSDQAVNNDIGVRLYFTKYNWNVTHFGSGAGDQDEIEDGFDPTSVNAGRRDYSGEPRLSHRSAPKNVGTLDGTEAYAEYPATYLGPTTLPGYYKFGVGNFGTIILPVSIINVKAYKNGNNVNIDWSALNEVNTDHYEVERSSNGVSFGAITQTAAFNNGNQQNNYSVTDIHPINGNNFYRIKAIDKDGQVKYSAIVSVNINSNYVGIKVLPNPVNNRLMNVQLSNLPAGKYELLLYSVNGQRVFNTSFMFNGGFASQVIVLPLNIRTGAYVLKLFNGSNKFTQNIMVE